MDEICTADDDVVQERHFLLVRRGMGIGFVVMHSCGRVGVLLPIVTALSNDGLSAWWEVGGRGISFGGKIIACPSSFGSHKVFSAVDIVRATPLEVRDKYVESKHFTTLTLKPYVQTVS